MATSVAVRPAPGTEILGKLRRIAREPVLALTILAVAGLLFLLIVYPVSLVALWGLRDQAGNFSIDNFAVLWQRPIVQKAIWNTFVLVLISVPLGTIVATFVGYVLTCTDVPARRLMRILITLPMIFPPFTGAMGLLMLFGRRGLITYDILGLENFSIYGMHGIILLQTIECIPLLSLIVSGTFAAISRDMEEAAEDLGARRLRVLFTITFPLALPGILSAALLHLISVISDFGTPMIVGKGFSVLAVEAYSQIMYTYDLALGTALCTALLVPALFGFIAYHYLLGRRSYVTVTGAARGPIIHTMPWFIKWLVFLFLCLIVFWNFSQLAVYFAGAFTKLFPRDLTFTLDHFQEWFRTTKQLQNSLSTSMAAALAGGVLAAVLAYLVTKQDFPGRKLMDYIGTLPWGIPGTVKGVGYILAFNFAPFFWTGTYFILILVNIARSIPLALRANVAALQQLDPSLDEASLDLGASRVRTFVQIILPLIRSSFILGIIYIFKDAMTNLSSAIMLITPRTELVYTTMFANMTKGAQGDALALGLEIFLINIVLLLLITRLTKRSPLELFQI